MQVIMAKKTKESKSENDLYAEMMQKKMGTAKKKTVKKTKKK